MSTSAHGSPRPWTEQEDRLLIAAVSKYGESTRRERIWKAIASEVGTRNSTQCQQRWSKALRPGLQKGQWSKEEDEQLLRLVGMFGTNWPKIAHNWPSQKGSCRTTKQIRERWMNKLDPSISKAPWSAAEDQQILHLHESFGNSWSKIASHLPGRVADGVGEWRRCVAEHELKN